METILAVENLRKTFRTKRRGKTVSDGETSAGTRRLQEILAVNDISFTVNRGDILAFIGPNGAGKSTTIKLITGILHPDSGNISLLGADPHRSRKKLSFEIGTVFGQKSQLWFHLPPLDSFRLLGAIYHMSPSDTEQRIRELRDEFEIGDYLYQPVRKLSLGQRIRCEIAASLIHSPSILFLDEPTIGLDVIARAKIRDLIRRINAENDVTIFLTSHDAGDIEKICRRAMVINHGSIVWDGTVNEMKYKLLNKRVIDIKHDGTGRWQLADLHELKRGKYSLKLEVDLRRQELEQVLGELLKNGGIQDIAISPAPMEEIITAIYRGEV